MATARLQDIERLGEVGHVLEWRFRNSLRSNMLEGDAA
jgi:hypothetical protein